MNDIKKNRVYLIDEIRGFGILYVVMYHLLFDLYAIFGVNMPWFTSSWMEQIRLLVVSLLIIIAGMSCHFTRSNARRGIKTLVFAMGLTLVTWVATPDFTVVFGILHFFGVAMVLYALIGKWVEKIPKLWGTLLFGLLFYVTYNTSGGTMGFPILDLTWYIPDFLHNKLVLFPLGFHVDGVLSGDYYPLLPWFFMFLAGSLWGKDIKEGKGLKVYYKEHLPLLGTIGKHTMIIYLVHQPIIFGALSLFFKYN